MLDGPRGLGARGSARNGSAPGTLVLTEQGRAAHTRVAALVDRSRAAVMKGLSPQEYSRTVENLATMARNVEAVLAQPPV